MPQPSEVDQRNLFQRLNAAQKEVDYIQKERKSGMNYTIVSHDAVTAKVRHVLVEHGIIYYPVEMNRSQEGNRTQIDATIRFVNIDNPTDFMDVKSCGYGIDSQDKGPGKAISYCVKYALLKALGLETGDDPDEQSIPHKPDAKPDPSSTDIRKEAENTADGLIAAIRKKDDLFALSAYWKEFQVDINDLPADLKAKVTAAKDERKVALQAVPQAAE